MRSRTKQLIYYSTKKWRARNIEEFQLKVEKKNEQIIKNKKKFLKNKIALKEWHKMALPKSKHKKNARQNVNELISTFAFCWL